VPVKKQSDLFKPLLVRDIKKILPQLKVKCSADILSTTDRLDVTNLMGLKTQSDTRKRLTVLSDLSMHPQVRLFIKY